MALVMLLEIAEIVAVMVDIILVIAKTRMVETRKAVFVYFAIKGLANRLNRK